MVKVDEKEEILTEIKKIENSPLSVRDYFNQNTVPFSRSQYYIYRKTLLQFGENGLRDKRTDGNNTKLTSRIKDYIITIVSENREIPSSQLQERIKTQFGISVTESCLNSFRSSTSITRVRPLPKKIYTHQKSGGGEILTALAFFSHIIDIYTQTIIERMEEIRESELFEKNKNIPQDNLEYRQNGKFTCEYNQLSTVRENRFKSIDEKILTKNLSTMNIFKMSEKTISRYNLALLCLPLVTSNGKSSRINRVKGNDLAFLCGENYKDGSIERYLQELKYLKISDKLIDATAKFWQDFWRNEFGNETLFACYYIDGNTRPLWSSNRCYKGKVTMLGRVMNCLENVFIHDGKGHPLYFQTFHGHGDLGKHALNMLTKLTQLIDDPKAQASVKRILVFDGGGNGVSTLRSFSDSEQYYITILDDNQVKPRKIKNTRKQERYKYGESFLYESKIELEDSLEKGYIHECRSVSVDWDNGKRTVLITNIPRELLDASELTKKYFDRWPQQEKQFRDAKSGVNIHRIVGYGMKIENYERMNEKHAKLCEMISLLKTKLEKPLREIDLINEKLVFLFAQEKIFREISQIVDGKRILSDEDSAEMQVCVTEINQLNRQLNHIKRDYKEDFKRYNKCIREENRIRDKDKVYKIDLELDQIMTCFKMSFVNLCSLFLTKCMNYEKFEILTLFESVFQLEGYSVVEKEKKSIKLEMNTKEPNMIDKISNALHILNGMDLQDLNGRAVKFIV